MTRSRCKTVQSHFTRGLCRSWAGGRSLEQGSAWWALIPTNLIRSVSPEYSTSTSSSNEVLLSKASLFDAPFPFSSGGMMQLGSASAASSSFLKPATDLAQSVLAFGVLWGFTNPWI